MANINLDELRARYPVEDSAFVHREHRSDAIRAGRALGTLGRAYGKEKVYGSIP